jgi:hypothetical protein
VNDFYILYYILWVLNLHFCNGNILLYLFNTIWDLIHMCMEEMLGIFLYCYLYLKPRKNAISFLLSLKFSLQQNWRTREQNRFCQEAEGRVRWPKQCIHIWVNVRNDKNKISKWKLKIMYFYECPKANAVTNKISTEWAHWLVLEILTLSTVLFKTEKYIS